MAKQRQKQRRVVVARIEIDASVRLAKFPGFDIRITPENRIFFLNCDSAYFPTLVGSRRIATDFPGDLPAEVYEQLYKLLTTQASVRLHQRQTAEDEDLVVI